MSHVSIILDLITVTILVKIANYEVLNYVVFFSLLLTNYLPDIYIHITLFSVSFDLCSAVTKKGIERGTETTESFRIPCALKNRPASVLHTLRLSVKRRIRTWCIPVCKYFPRPPEQGAQTDTVCTGALPFTVTSFPVRKEFSCNDNVLRTLRCEVGSWCSKLKGILPLYHCYVIELIP
jgi:hypothetical protein